MKPEYEPEPRYPEMTGLPGYSRRDEELDKVHELDDTPYHTAG